MTRKSQTRLAPLLETLYRNSPPAQVESDPIAIPHRYHDPIEIELTGWLAVSFAYGRAPFFNKTVDQILALSNRSFFHYLQMFNLEKERPRFHHIYYRFNRSEDILALVYIMSEMIKQYGSVKSLFISCYQEDDEDIGATLSRFIEVIKGIDTTPVYGVIKKPKGLLQFFPSPTQNSACKRWNLYLRWMVRPNDGIDFGLWKEISPSKLIIPLDTHIARIGHYLGLTSRKSTDWTMAKEITQNLKKIDPVDPLKYDFSLCHLGISGACPILPNAKKCMLCPLLQACRRGVAITRRKHLNFSAKT
jgi:uncharacterized protein (TIGR02757 family)